MHVLGCIFHPCSKAKLLGINKLPMGFEGSGATALRSSTIPFDRENWSDNPRSDRAVQQHGESGYVAIALDCTDCVAWSTNLQLAIASLDRPTLGANEMVA